MLMPNESRRRTVRHSNRYTHSPSVPHIFIKNPTHSFCNLLISSLMSHKEGKINKSKIDSSADVHKSCLALETQKMSSSKFILYLCPEKSGKTRRAHMSLIKIQKKC